MHVVATAGHVDHGKSSVVQLLTGRDPDRYAEEKRRGLTIDLGFAWTTAGDGTPLAFVDVPGHERFVSTMLAGVGPVPAVMFVVAANEGWQPQSAEHLAAIAALGVRHGLLVVTKSDLADPTPVALDARNRMARTSLGDVAAVAVSRHDGASIDRLRAGLDALVGRLPSPDTAAPVRFWIDRCFTIRGVGTVVTGTLGAGRIHVGDTLTIGGSPEAVVVRGLQSLERPVDVAGPVSRLAVNLRGVARERLTRGMALTTPGAWTSTQRLDVRLSRAEDLPREAVVHVGSAAVSARLRVLDGAYARVELSEPMPLAVGDRVLLREPAAHRILSGADILDVRPPALSRRGAAKQRAHDLEHPAVAAPESPVEAAPVGPPDTVPDSAELVELLQRLATDPLDAPESGDIAVGRAELGAAARSGRLVNLGRGIYVGAAAVDAALAVLSDLEQPFTLSAARQALGTTRRIAVPLLEHLDLLRKTRRVDETHRIVVADSPRS